MPRQIFKGWMMARFSILFGGLTMVALAMAAPASSKTQPLAAAAPPKIFQDVVECRASLTRPIAWPASTAASVRLPLRRQQGLYVADKEAMREARAGLFGFSLPKMRIFADDDMEKAVNSVESTVSAIAEGQRGYVFTLKDGARWRQTDGAYMDKPKVGASIRIRRGTLGSFFGSVGGKPGFRIERVN